jgi:DNA adenine methylase
MKEENRNPVIEALVTNFIAISTEHRKESQTQYMLLEPQATYGVV